MARSDDVKFDMIRRLRVADYITLSNAFCGVLSLFYSMKRCFITAHVLIFIGYECDYLDGKVARWRNECSDWGKELDSFSDLVTFVVAPAVMLYCAGLCTPVDQAALAFYVLCGVTRLARFNVVVSLVPKNEIGRASYIEGLPTAYAALIISTTIAVSAWMDQTSQPRSMTSMFQGTVYEADWATISVMFLSAAMASKRLRFSFDGTWSIPSAMAAIFISCWWVSPV